MKWLIVGLSLSLCGIALAADTCDADCAEVGKMCGDGCKTALKKDNPDKLKYCTDKCKEFVSECKKDCKSEK